MFYVRWISYLNNKPKIHFRWSLLYMSYISFRSSETCLEEALNVLARGLESNKDNSVLWLEYLVLYARHKEASDFSDLCQMALQYAPSFEIWWKVCNNLNPLFSWNWKWSAFATSIEPGHPAHPCSLTRLYTVGWPISSSNLDVPKSYKVPKMEGGLFQIRNFSVLRVNYSSYLGTEDLHQQDW